MKAPATPGGAEPIERLCIPGAVDPWRSRCTPVGILNRMKLASPFGHNASRLPLAAIA